METALKNIKELSVADRPREKLIYLGAQALSNTDLIAIILRMGNRSTPLASICRSLVDAIDNNISNLDALSVSKLLKSKVLER